MRTWKLFLLALFSLAATHSADPPKLTAREEKFQKALANCVLNGRWCTVEKNQMGDEYHDKYTIQGATKVSGENWLIYARIEYLGKNISVPVPVHLKWAGNTPVITLDSVSVPGLGSYSARVLIHENTYAGVWSAKDHGGMLHGLIQKPAQPR